MKQFIHNKAFTRKLLLGRRSVQDKSLLERILSDSRLDRCLEVIWNRFNLHEKAELISIVSLSVQPLIWDILNI